jgi:hypothetical protein
VRNCRDWCEEFFLPLGTRLPGGLQGKGRNNTIPTVLRAQLDRARNYTTQTLPDAYRRPAAYGS